MGNFKRKSQTKIKVLISNSYNKSGDYSAKKKHGRPKKEESTSKAFKTIGSSEDAADKVFIMLSEEGKDEGHKTQKIEANSLTYFREFIDSNYCEKISAPKAATNAIREWIRIQYRNYIMKSSGRALFFIIESSVIEDDGNYFDENELRLEQARIKFKMLPAEAVDENIPDCRLPQYFKDYDFTCFEISDIIKLNQVQKKCIIELFDMATERFSELRALTNPPTKSKNETPQRHLEKTYDVAIKNHEALEKLKASVNLRFEDIVVLKN
ncbi:MAG: hypothetical protein AABY64_09195 [Bdellovibrionota bacterium]